MTSTNARESSGHTRTGTVSSVTVKNWPLRDGGFSAWTFVLCCVMLSCFAGYSTSSPVTALACFGFLLIASGRLWIPVRYTFHSKGITVGYPTYEQKLPWRRFRHALVSPKGISLVL